MQLHATCLWKRKFNVTCRHKILSDVSVTFSVSIIRVSVSDPDDGDVGYVYMYPGIPYQPRLSITHHFSFSPHKHGFCDSDQFFQRFGRTYCVCLRDINHAGDSRFFRSPARLYDVAFRKTRFWFECSCRYCADLGGSRSWTCGGTRSLLCLTCCSTVGGLSSRRLLSTAGTWVPRSAAGTFVTRTASTCSRSVHRGGRPASG